MTKEFLKRYKPKNKVKFPFIRKEYRIEKSQVEKKPKISFILSSSVSPRKLICKECNKKFKTNAEASNHSQKKQHYEYKLEGTEVELMIG